jgi:phosphatidate phosphatase APP1
VYPRPGRPVTVRIAGEQRCLGSTGRNGHIESTITLTDRQVRQVRASNEIAGGCLPVQLVGQRPHDPPVIGPVHLLPREGLSVISDIDDTIKVSHVGSHRKLLAHTFVRRYRPVKGIADIYRGWHEQGARFHYVSSTPWQLYLPLSEFFEKVKLPGGTFHLKLFRWRDSSFFDLFASPKRTKRRAIEPILHDLPNRRFILVGDAGEKDPEVYGALARQHPERIVRIFIRNLKGDSPDAPRYRKAFDGIDRKSWCLFDDPRELIDLKLD